MSADDSTLLTEPVLRIETQQAIADAFCGGDWGAVIGMQADLHREATVGSLRVRWRGAGVIRIFEIEALALSLAEFRLKVIDQIVNAIVRQLERTPVNEDH